MNASLLHIITAPDIRLKKKAQNITKFDERIENFANNMIYTMRSSDGCGLAAIQVLDNLEFEELNHDSIYRAQPNIFVMIMDNEIDTAVINPEIISFSEEKKEDTEGCLSLPYFEAKVQRPFSIKVKYQNIKGEIIMQTLENLNARIFQHEFDHNQGILYPNRLNRLGEALFWKRYNN